MPYRFCLQAYQSYRSIFLIRSFLLFCLKTKTNLKLKLKISELDWREVIPKEVQSLIYRKYRIKFHKLSYDFHMHVSTFTRHTHAVAQLVDAYLACIQGLDWPSTLLHKLCVVVYTCSPGSGCGSKSLRSPRPSATCKF